MSLFRATTLRLSSFDKYVLLNHPIVWETRLHLVVPGCLLAWCVTGLGIITFFPTSERFAPNPALLFSITLAFSALLWCFWLWRIARMGARKCFATGTSGISRSICWIVCTIFIYILPWIATEALQQNIRQRLDRHEVFEDLLRLNLILLASGNARESTEYLYLFCRWSSNLELEDLAPLLTFSTRSALCLEFSKENSTLLSHEDFQALAHVSCSTQTTTIEHLADRLELREFNVGLREPNWSCNPANFGENQVNTLTTMARMLSNKYDIFVEFPAGLNTLHSIRNKETSFSFILRALDLQSQTPYQNVRYHIISFSLINWALWSALCYCTLRLPGTIGGATTVSVFLILAIAANELAEQEFYLPTGFFFFLLCILSFIIFISFTILVSSTQAKRWPLTVAASTALTCHSAFLIFLFSSIVQSTEGSVLAWSGATAAIWAAGLPLAQRWLNRYDALPEN